MGTRHLTSKFLTSTSLIFSFALLVVFPYCASAVEISPTVEFVGGYSQPYWQSSNGEAYKSGSMAFSNNDTYQSTNYLRIRKNDNTNLVVSGGNYASVLISIIVKSHTANNAATNIASWGSGVFGFSAAGVSNTDCGIIDLDYNLQEASQTSSPQTYYYRYDVEYICRVQSSGATNPTSNFWISTIGTTGVSNISANVRRITLWQPSGEFDDSAIVAAINTTNSRLNSIINLFNSANTLIGNTNDKLDDMLDGIGNLNTLQQQANDDANDRYDDEKDTINNAANDAETNASGQDFSFSIPNPLQSWFGGFSDNECVNIPNLAVWLHSNETRICTPWPSSVRTVVTTVVTGMFMLLLFGFIISWVKKNDTGGN